MVRSVRVISFSIFLLLGLSTASAQTNDLAGTWLTGNGDARIRIAPCGANQCGSIVWLRDPIDPATGRPQIDDKNQDASKRNRPIIGMQMLEMRPQANGGWQGPIYNSDDGATYQTTITLTSPTTLTVRGCVGLMCGDDRWTKVEEPQPQRQQRRR